MDHGDIISPWFDSFLRDYILGAIYLGGYFNGRSFSGDSFPRRNFLGEILRGQFFCPLFKVALSKNQIR